MRQRWAFVHFLLLASFTGILLGCPGQPALIVSRDSISFGEAGVSASFTIRNGGAATLSWTVEEVVRDAADLPWRAQNIPWLDVDPTAGATTTTMDRVTLTASRENLPIGTQQNTGVRVRSNGGDKVIPVSIIAAPTLSVSPTTIPLSPTATSAEFTVRNSGSETATWSVLYLPNPAAPQNTQPLPAGIQVQPNPGSTPPGGSTTVVVAFVEGQQDFHLLVQSDRGNAVVSFLFGAALQGLQATPSPLTLYINSAGTGEPGQALNSILRITNTGAASRTWTLETANRVDPATPAPIALRPNAGSTPAGGESLIEVRVTDIANVVTGSGAYDVILRSGEGFMIIPVIVEIMPLPIITLSEPPQVTAQRPEISQINILDFGRERIQAQFYIANTGPRGSRLQFRITYDGQGEENPLLASVTPLQGDTNGPEEVFFWPPGSNLLIDAQPVTVTIDRSAMTETIEDRIITVTAYDADLEEPLEIVAPVKLTVRVERPPLKVQGAINRGRPPFVNRWILLLRDDEGRVIPTRTPEERSRIHFRVTENGFDIDLDETNQFMDGPGALKVNLVVLLDFTGSMYFAGTRHPENPLAPGEALAQIRQATKQFLDDLPANWQVSLMYYNDRQQRNRLIAPFTTDRASLKTALDEFSLPAAQHGLSAIYDALEDAVNRLVAEDPIETLPFDDADVRAIVYITDGRDTGSLINQNDVVTLARDNRVQFYPLGYSASGETRTADLITMAEETGGFPYSAGNVQNLARLLGNDKALALEPAEAIAEGSAFFQVVNLGSAPLAWTTQIESGASWITGVTPASATTPINGSTLVRVNVNPALAPAGRLTEGSVAITSANGVGVASLRMRTSADGNIVSLDVTLEDEPGRVWEELRNQLVFSYITPLQDAGDYQLHVRYTKPDGQNINGQFEEDGVFFAGDIQAGQIALRTSGIFENSRAAADEEPIAAEVFVRAEYVPRGVNRFRMRFFTLLPPDAPPGALALLNQIQMQVELAPDGLLVPEDSFSPDWRLVSGGDGIYVMLTEEENPLPYGAFGNLLRLQFTGLQPYVDLFNSFGRNAEFLLAMRVDNDIYYAPATPGRPSQTKYFLYPGGPTAPGRALLISQSTSDLAPPALTALLLQDPGIDPEAPGAFDQDGDGLPDFQDSDTENPDVPGSILVPQRVEIEVGQDTATLVVRNNRLDTFSWALEPNSVPDWLTVTPVGAQPLFTLAPGQSQALTVTADRTTLPDGFNSANLRFQFDKFADQVTPVVVIVAQP